MAGDRDPPILTSENSRNIFETYVQDYLERMNLHLTSKALKLESDVNFCPEILRKYDGPKGHLYEWWSIFYDKYRAKYQRVQMPHQNQQVQVPDLNQPVQAPSEHSGGGSTSMNQQVRIPDLNQPVQAPSEQSGEGSSSTNQQVQIPDLNQPVQAPSEQSGEGSGPTVAGDLPTLASYNHRPIFETYLHNYLEKMNLRQTAAILELETNVKFYPEILRQYDGPKGFLYDWWLIFYETFSARHQQVQIPPQNQQIQAPGGQSVGDATISDTDPEIIQAPIGNEGGSPPIMDLDNIAKYWTYLPVDLFRYG